MQRGARPETDKQRSSATPSTGDAVTWALLSQFEHTTFSGRRMRIDSTSNAHPSPSLIRLLECVIDSLKERVGQKDVDSISP